MLPESFSIVRASNEQGVLHGIFNHSMSLRGAVARAKFPTRFILNDFFRCGRDDVDQKLGCFEVDINGAVMHWPPFELTHSEYDAFIRSLRDAGYAFEITSLDAATFGEWFCRC